jgi:hypothetical protein
LLLLLLLPLLLLPLLHNSKPEQGSPGHSWRKRRVSQLWRASMGMMTTWQTT